MVTKQELILHIQKGDLETFPITLATYLKKHDIDSLQLNQPFLLQTIINNTPHVRYTLFLTIAAQRGHINTATLLLAHGATIASTSNGSVNILVAGVSSGSVAMVRFLLENGANISDANCLFTNPLIHATELGYVDIVALLLVEHHNKNCEIKDNHLIDAALAHLPSSQKTALALIEVFIEHGLTTIPSEFILPRKNTSIDLLSELFKIFEKTGKYLEGSRHFNDTTQAQIKQHHDRLDKQREATTQLIQKKIPAMLPTLVPIITNYLFEPNPSLNLTPLFDIHTSHDNPSNNDVNTLAGPVPKYKEK